MAALGAAQYTELVASTLEKIESNLVDQVFSQHPTLDILKKYAKPASGRSLVLNLELAEDDNTTVTDASGTFADTVSPDIIGAAEFAWSMPYVSKVRVEWLTLQKNTGKQALVNLLESHVENVKKSHAKRLVTGLHKADSAVGATEFNSFDLLFGDADTDLANGVAVGGIVTDDGAGTPAAVADHPWQSTRYTSSRAGETIRKAVRSLRNQITIRSGGYANITHIIAGLNVFEEYEDSFDDKIRYVDFKEGQTRFRAIYDGDIEIRLDPDADVDTAWFISGDNLRMQNLNGNFMKVQPTQAIPNTLDFITPLASVLAVGTNARRNHGKLVRTA